ncbi:MAG TPA: ribosome biogenesis GTPase Der [Vicinamibacteria bacterium]|nr:ribosome biogenesis GTPase Der [Vicinamibacteria bacterium]
MIAIPRLALVGRPNVGKSTLFNRICGRRKAITDGRPGSTRDRNYAQTSWQGADFELVDTGGLLLDTDDPLLGPAALQAERAIDEADRVVLVVDARSGRLPDDDAIASRLRKKGKVVVVAVNKAEGAEAAEAEFAPLGFPAVVALSAEHGLGVGDLLDRALEGLPRVQRDEAEPTLRIALVGRPNVGKSSLLNQLLGEERALVSPIPGTTRDTVDSTLERDGQRFLFVDTAGIRRPRLLQENVDHVSVVQARKAIERCEVAVLLLDPIDGMREMDATIGGYVQEAGRAVVLAVNKWDLAVAGKVGTKAFEQTVRDALKFLTHAPIVWVSARTGRGAKALLAAAVRVGGAFRQRVTTGQLNRVLARAAQEYAPKAAKGGQPVRILYGAQVGVAPPTFVISLNHPVDLHFSYKRYLENQLRKEFGFEGAPIRLKVRARAH